MLYIIPRGSKILFLEEGIKVLRFEDFKSPNKLDWRVYLATNTQASDYIDFGPLKEISKIKIINYLHILIC